VITTIPVDEEPRALIHNSTNNKVYCANWGRPGNVTIIDGGTDSVITTITVGDDPGGLVYNPTNNKVYCANAFSRDVTVIDGAADSVITTIPTWPPGSPAGPAMLYNHINNKIYCAMAIGLCVNIIDGLSDTLVTHIGVGDGVWDLAWNPVQNRTYVAIFYDADVAVIRDSLTGIEELTEEASPLTVNIYPNPTKRALTIHASVPLRIVKVYDILGDLVREKNITKLDNTTAISLRNLSAGVYFVKVNTEGTELIRKVIVTK
jgi:YVTN family beta-propeller protein